MQTPNLVQPHIMQANRVVEACEQRHAAAVLVFKSFVMDGNKIEADNARNMAHTTLDVALDAHAELHRVIRKEFGL